MSKREANHVTSLRSWLQRNNEEHHRELASKMAELFSGGSDFHGEQWRGPNRTTGFATKSGAIDRDLILKHLGGSRCLGMIGPRSGDTLMQNCLLMTGRQERFDPDERDKVPEATMERVLFARKQLAALGIDALCVRHEPHLFAIWLFYETPLNASMTRALIFKVLWSRVGPSTKFSDGVFPLTSYHARMHAVPPMALPFGRDRVTGVRTFAVDENGQRIENTLEELKRLRPTPARLIKEANEALKPDADKAVAASLDRRRKDRSAQLLQLDRCRRAHLRLVEE